MSESFLNYKVRHGSFRRQMIACKEDRVCVPDVHCPCCEGPLPGATFLICRKYGTICHSGICREERKIIYEREGRSTDRVPESGS